MGSVYKICLVSETKCTRFRKANMLKTTGTRSARSFSMDKHASAPMIFHFMQASFCAFHRSWTYSAERHTTTYIIKPPDPGENHDNIIPLRTVAHVTFHSIGSTKIKCKDISLANEAILGTPESHLFSGSTENKCDTSTFFPSNKIDVFSPSQKTAYSTNSSRIKNKSRIFSDLNA